MANVDYTRNFRIEPLLKQKQCKVYTIVYTAERTASDYIDQIIE